MTPFAKIPFPLLNDVMAYLAEQKWKEVANLIARLDAAAQQTLSESQPKPEKVQDGILPKVEP